MPQYELVYLCTPKVACSSIKYALASLRFGRDLDPFGRDQALHIHEDIFIGRSLDVISAKFQDYFKFSFVRNPWDRLVSCYYSKVWQQETMLPHLRKLGFHPQMQFKEFVTTVCQIPDDQADEHFKSQYALITNKGEIAPDFVGRFERLSEDWEKLRLHLQSRLNRMLPHLPHVNHQPRAPYQSHYDKRLEGMVAARYRPDIEFFYYHFT
jgi:hypothetical protein